jgi:hypothetical protein
MEKKSYNIEIFGITGACLNAVQIAMEIIKKRC